jgi:hypothetical protein
VPAPAPVVIAINARTADGHDPSWLWDVPFELLRGRAVTATGERGLDLAVRLHYGEVDHTVEPSVSEALRKLGTREHPVGAGAHAAGAQTAGAQTAGAQTVGAQTVGAQTVGAQTAGAQTVGAQTVGAQTVGAQTVGAQTIDVVANYTAFHQALALLRKGGPDASGAPGASGHAGSPNGVSTP